MAVQAVQCVAVANRPTGAAALVVVTGEADMATAATLSALIVDALAQTSESLTVDISGLGFCDLMGLDGLHAAERAATGAGVIIAWRGMSRQLTWLYNMGVAV